MEKGRREGETRVALHRVETARVTDEDAARKPRNIAIDWLMVRTRIRNRNDKNSTKQPSLQQTHQNKVRLNLNAEHLARLVV